jgi:hypothetical protein
MSSAARSSAPAPPRIPRHEPLHEAHDVAVGVIRRAAVAYHAAEAFRRKVEAAGLSTADDPQGPTWRLWARLADDAAVDAEVALVRALLAAHGRLDDADGPLDPSDLSPGWRPCLFELDETYYAIDPTSDDDPTPVLRVLDSEVVSIDFGDFPGTRPALRDSAGPPRLGVVDPDGGAR